ncbi:hypothetical protein COT51_00825 [candidate division WWE3 bacterium CG08_land_8_20_14_0_20_41_15]|uniref:Uncharacterized protein n=1 Tax=candidate division WWE3 bacterium CG08_land_8_20_14_0_20_41_15 TaxID=1975086 RepID=A0A2H0XAC4_UNCKA|nr:MAG: hypothetical protein COT51_00825 [candidate division WWE3 bacterium CG08_land_8_20_14_0_20_41_15]
MKDWLEKHRKWITGAFFLLLLILILNAILNFGLASVGALIIGGVLGLIVFLILTNSFWPNLKWIVGLGLLIAFLILLSTCGSFWIKTIEICP